MNWDENANLLKVGREHDDEMRDGGVNDIVRYLAYLEMAAYIISYPFLASFAIVIARKRSITIPLLQIFHLSLVVLLLNVAASLFVSVVSLTIMLLIQLCWVQFIASAVYTWASKLSDVGMYAMAFNLISLVVERVAASSVSRFYEKFCSRIPYLGFTLCFLEFFGLLPVVAGSGYQRGLRRLYAEDGQSLT
ncbi:unnamed protein product [Toxocara canis]|uniref:G_PROTEIN_RECEP_F1_2 domain-containing protein n=1 Tax=Toxocara canis TaxID=6265 RepID=A0A183UXU2_TOXCA|nr:unnamed protein product [Toxocara canis]